MTSETPFWCILWSKTSGGFWIRPRGFYYVLIMYSPRVLKKIWSTLECSLIFCSLFCSSALLPRPCAFLMFIQRTQPYMLSYLFGSQVQRLCRPVVSLMSMFTLWSLWTWCAEAFNAFGVSLVVRLNMVCYDIGKNYTEFLIFVHNLSYFYSGLE